MRRLPLTAYLPTIKGLIENTWKREAVNPFYASFKVTSRCHFGCAFCNVKQEPAAEPADRGHKGDPAQSFAIVGAHDEF